MKVAKLNCRTVLWMLLIEPTQDTSALVKAFFRALHEFQRVQDFREGKRRSSAEVDILKEAD